MNEPVRAVVNGKTISLSRQGVIGSMKGVAPEAVRRHAVDIAGVLYPVNQVFSRATGLDRLDFTSAVARRYLIRLGFSVKREA